MCVCTKWELHLPEIKCTPQAGSTGFNKMKAEELLTASAY